MVLPVRLAFCLLATLNTDPPITAAAEPAQQQPTEKKANKYADPKSTYRTYVEAVRKNDIKAAKACWVIDDGNKSGALDTIVGLWISMRRINQVAEKRFGAQDLDRVLTGWRRDDITDQALEFTRKQLEKASIKYEGNHAQLTIPWKDADGGSHAAFEYGKESIEFTRVDRAWKLDANKMTGLKHGADFFEKGTWGPLFRDQVAIMNQAIEAMEKGRLKSAKQLGAFIDRKIQVVRKKHEQEEKKAAPKSK
jgi:hypothetical protein